MELNVQIKRVNLRESHSVSLCNVLCGHYKLTVNQVSRREQYPIPRIPDLFASLSGGQKFTKLDLSQAYHQIPLDEEARKFVTINTHKGLFTYKVLPFGVSSSPAIFTNNGGTAAEYPSRGRVLG